MTVLTAAHTPSLSSVLAVWLASEAAAKIARIAATVMAARMLSVEALGLVALVLAFGEILKSLAENGVGQKIIAAAPDELASVCKRAAQIFRIWCGLLFLAGCGIAGVLYLASDQTEGALLLVVFSAQFLFMPLGLVSCFLAMRNGRSKAVAAVAGGQVVLSAIIAIALLAVWPCAAAMILPRLLTALPWALAMRALAPWSVDPSVSAAPLKPFIGFGASVMGVEALKAVRMQADKFIIGATLGLDALGIWFFAMNAGLGLASSFANAFALALFPRLCANTQGKERRGTLHKAMIFAICALSPIIVLQALSAPLYVPFIYGADWSGMEKLVSILCLAAVPGVIWTATSQWLRAEGRASTEFVCALGIALLLMLSLMVAAPFGLQVAAYTFLGATAAGHLLAIAIVLWPAKQRA